MARTYRCRHEVPNGWVVRDGLYACPAAYPSKSRVTRRMKELYKAYHAGEISWLEYRNLEDEVWPHGHFSIHYMRHEITYIRKLHQRKYRAAVKNRMRHEDYEGIPNFRKTSGWESW